MGRNSTGARGGSLLGTRVVGAGVLRNIREAGGGAIRATSQERLARVGQLFDRGQQNQGRGVLVTVGRDGRMTVEDGRHRILNALQRGVPLRVTFRRGR